MRVSAVSQLLAGNDLLSLGPFNPGELIKAVTIISDQSSPFTYIFGMCSTATERPEVETFSSAPLALLSSAGDPLTLILNERVRVKRFLNFFFSAGGSTVQLFAQRGYS